MAIWAYAHEYDDRSEMTSRAVYGGLSLAVADQRQERWLGGWCFEPPAREISTGFRDVGCTHD